MASLPGWTTSHISTDLTLSGGCDGAAQESLAFSKA